MSVTYKKIENKERYITIKFRTKKSWKVLEENIESFLNQVTDEDSIADVHEFNSPQEQAKDKEAPKPAPADVLKQKHDE